MENADWLRPVPDIDRGEDLGQFPADAKPKVPAPDSTIHKQVDLSGCTSWSLEDCKGAMDLLLEFVDVFSRHDLDLGETSALGHGIKLELNSWPFHERYHPIP